MDYLCDCDCDYVCVTVISCVLIIFLHVLFSAILFVYFYHILMKTAQLLKYHIKINIFFVRWLIRTANEIICYIVVNSCISILFSLHYYMSYYIILKYLYPIFMVILLFYFVNNLQPSLFSLWLSSRSDQYIQVLHGF